MKKKLKGFTLMEMIIVIALFGLIMAGALSLLQPLNRVFKDTLEYEGSRATVDNIRLYLEDNLRYSNRLHMYTKVNLNNIIDDTVGIKGKGIIRIDNDIYSENLDSAVTFMRKKYKIGNPNRISDTNDIVYVIYVDNPEDITLDLNINDATNRGKITVYTFKNGVEIASERKVLSEVAYREYSFALNLGQRIADATVTNTSGTESHGYEQYDLFNPANFAMTLNIYKNKRNGSVFKAEDLRSPSVVTFALVNIFGKNGSLLDETITLKDTSPNATEPLKENIPRYGFYEGIEDTNDIFFVFTKPTRPEL
jgi:prepilin-type N-terminal cleavage/methylation domain-containing protein